MQKGFWQCKKCFSRTGILFIVPLFLMAALFILPCKVMAQEGYGPGTDKWKFELGAYFPSVKTELQVDTGDNTINVEDVLKLSENEIVGRFDGYWRFARKHRLAFGYYRLNRDARTALDVDLDIGGETWYAGALVDSDLTMDFYQLTYLYSFYQGEKWEISGALGAYWVRLKTEIALAAEMTNPTPPPPTIGTSERFESDTFEGPLPLLGLSFDYYITPKWMATLKGSYFQLTINDYKGRITNLGAKLEYQFTKTFGLGLGYDAFRLEVEAEDADGFAKVDYKYHGVQLYGILRF